MRNVLFKQRGASFPSFARWPAARRFSPCACWRCRSGCGGPPNPHRCAVVPKWGRFEQSFKSGVLYSNALQDATLTVLFTSPLGETNLVYGFWDGDKNWRVRFSPKPAGALDLQNHLLRCLQRRPPQPRRRLPLHRPHRHEPLPSPWPRPGGPRPSPPRTCRWHALLLVGRYDLERDAGRRAH